VEKIQRYPQGLLELFALKGTGSSPLLLEESVRPTVDTLDFYSAITLARQSAVAGANVEGSTVAITVPQAIAWHMRGLHAQMIYGAATTIIGLVADLSPNGGGAAHSIFDRRIIAAELDAAGGGIIDVAWLFPQRMLLLPGSVMTVRLRELVGTITGWSMSALFHSYSVT
jgi:hypothetical protein